MRAHRFVRIDDEGVTVSRTRFRRYTLRWTELRAVSADRTALRFVSADGRERRAGLRMVRNRDGIAAAVGAAAERMGIAGPAPRAAPAAVTPAPAGPPSP